MSILTITGDLASGKSLIAKQLAALLGARYFSTGSIQREIAMKYRMTTLELNQYSETHPEIDREIDDRVRMLSDRDSDLVVDSRMAWHFLPDSFKIFLCTNIVRAAQRVVADTLRSSEPVYSDCNDAMLKLKERKRSENKRYLQLYNADCADLSNFDLVVDTTYSVPNDTIRIISATFENWRQQIPIQHFWYSPRSILPLRALWDFDTNSTLPNKQTGVEVVLCNGNPFVYGGEARLVAALREGCAYVPANVLAVDDERLANGQTATRFVETSYRPDILAQWEQEFGFKYLELSGRFGERQA